MVPELKPNQSEIERHIRHITRRWGELDQPVCFEIVCLSADDRAQVKHVARFSPDDMGIDMGAEHVAIMNGHGINTYIVVNPVDATKPLKPNSRASRDDIVASFYHWADADDAQAAENIKNFVGPKCTFHVLTGTQPSMRPHVYWELEEPTRNLDAWERTQKGIAATLRTDSSVTDPPRIMRIAGSINWPKPQKRAKGYVAELTTMRVYDEDERPPVSSERMARAFASAAPMPTASAPSGFSVDVGAQPLDRERMVIQAMQGQEWHHAVVRLVASYVSKGLSDAEIHALTDPLTLQGYTVDETRREVQVAIDGARRKGWTPEQTATPAETRIEEQKQLAPFDTTPINPADLFRIPPRRWIYGSKLVRGFVSVLASPGGMGKSALVTSMALDMAAGIETLHDAPHGKLKVWLYNLEDPRDETMRKVAAVVMHKHIPHDALQNLIVTSGRDRSLIIAEEVDRGVIVAMPDVPAMIEAIKAAKIDVLTVDPIVRSHRVQENDNKAVDFVMDLYARIADEANCAILLVHHTRKGFVSGDADSIRGGSAMTSAARVALTIQAMQPDEAQRLNIPDTQRKSYVRVDNAKANLSAPSEKAEWLKLESQQLGNGDAEYPDGDFVQVVTKWQPPLPWEGIGDKLVEIFDRIDRGHVSDDGSALPYGDHKNSGERWIVNAILASFPDGDFSEAQAIGCYNKWKADGFLIVKEGPNGRDRKPMKKCVFVKNRPAEGGGNDTDQ